jgi:hypothetical protein
MLLKGVITPDQIGRFPFGNIPFVSKAIFVGIICLIAIFLTAFCGWIFGNLEAIRKEDSAANK